MSKLAQIVSSNHNYQVASVPLYTATGAASGLFGTQRVDTQEVFAAVSPSYGVIQNADAIAAIEDGFSADGLTYSERKVFVMRGGAALEVRYDFQNTQIVVPRVNDILGLRISLKNSFDGTAPLAFEVGFLRLACLNGAKSLMREFFLTKKHYSGIQTGFVKDQISNAVKAAHDAALIFGDMARLTLPQDLGENLLENLATKKAISGKLGERVLNVWRAPKYVEDKGRNLYNMYNAFTQVLTHEIENERFEMANRERAKVTSLFAGFARDIDTLEPLLLKA